MWNAIRCVVKRTGALNLPSKVIRKKWQWQINIIKYFTFKLSNYHKHCNIEIKVSHIFICASNYRRTVLIRSRNLLDQHFSLSSSLYHSLSLRDRDSWHYNQFPPTHHTLSKQNSFAVGRKNFETSRCVWLADTLNNVRYKLHWLTIDWCKTNQIR